jgi:hypothetical protein
MWVLGRLAPLTWLLRERFVPPVPPCPCASATTSVQMLLWCCSPQMQGRGAGDHKPNGGVGVRMDRAQRWERGRVLGMRTWLDTMLVLLGRRAPSGEGPISRRLPPSCHTATSVLQSLGLTIQLTCADACHNARSLPYGIKPELVQSVQQSCTWPCSRKPSHVHDSMTQHSTRWSHQAGPGPPPGQGAAGRWRGCWCRGTRSCRRCAGSPRSRASSASARPRRACSRTPAAPWAARLGPAAGRRVDE